jgi:hypothetical protein
MHRVRAANGTDDLAVFDQWNAAAHVDRIAEAARRHSIAV